MMGYIPKFERIRATVGEVIADGQTRTIDVLGGPLEFYVCRTEDYMGGPWRDVGYRSAVDHCEAKAAALGVGEIVRKLVRGQHPSGTWPLSLNDTL